VTNESSCPGKGLHIGFLDELRHVFDKFKIRHSHEMVINGDIHRSIDHVVYQLGGTSQLPFNPGLNVIAHIDIDKKITEKHGQEKNKGNAGEKFKPDLQGIKENSHSIEPLRLRCCVLIL